MDIQNLNNRQFSNLPTLHNNQCDADLRLIADMPLALNWFASMSKESFL